MSGARLGSIAGWVTLAGILVFEVAGPTLVAGNRVTGTTDRAAISAYYEHGELLWFALGGFILVIVFVLFAVLLREELASNTVARRLANVGLALAVAAVPLLLLKTALQMSLVEAVAAGVDPLPLFLSWDYVYNAGVYALEAGYPVAFSLAMARQPGFPRWLPVFGVIVGALQLVNMTSLVIGLPDAATLPGNLAFAVWLAATAYGLGRRARLTAVSVTA